MTDISLQSEFDELRRRVIAVQSLCRQQPERLASLQPGATAELRRSLDELRDFVRACPDHEPSPPTVGLKSDTCLAKRKSAIIEASLDPVIATDYQGVVVEFNSSAERIFGYTRAYAVGRELAELIAPLRLRTHLRAAFAEFRDTRVSAWIGKRFEAVAVKADGTEFPVQIAVALIAHEDPPLLVVYLHDLTLRKHEDREVLRYQERLRSLTAELLLAEEGERRRLAIDLHDGLSQTIALVKMKLVALPQSQDPTQRQLLLEIGKLIDNANQSARSITFELSPPVLHDLGLEPAVQWLVEHMKARYGLDIALEDDGHAKPADEKTRIILFRAIRELLINIAKHARAQRVHICLKRVGNAVQATVDDDGVGMEPEAAGVRGSGLFSIRERLNHVGGSIEIDSLPGRGTSICLRAPLTARGTATMKVNT